MSPTMTTCRVIMLWAIAVANPALAQSNVAAERLDTSSCRSLPLTALLPVRSASGQRIFVEALNILPRSSGRLYLGSPTYIWPADSNALEFDNSAVGVTINSQNRFQKIPRPTDSSESIRQMRTLTDRLVRSPNSDAMFL